MLPNNGAFYGKEFYECDGKVFYRSHKIDRHGKFRLKIQVVSINSPYRQAIAFILSTAPKFKGTILINGQKFTPQKRKNIDYIMPVAFPDKTEITMELEVEEGYICIANASDFLDDYPDLIEKISAQTNRMRDQFRGCSYTSGFSPGLLYGNAFWMENLSETCWRFYCNDHKMDDDFDDLIFDVEMEELPPLEK